MCTFSPCLYYYSGFNMISVRYPEYNVCGCRSSIAKILLEMSGVLSWVKLASALTIFVAGLFPVPPSLGNPLFECLTILVCFGEKGRKLVSCLRSSTQGSPLNVERYINEQCNQLVSHGCRTLMFILGAAASVSPVVSAFRSSCS